MKNLKVVIIILISTLFLGGCAATGKHFSELEAVPTEQSVVYFYRPYNYQGGGLRLIVLDNEEEALKLKNAQYVRYVTAPGPHNFEPGNAGKKKGVDINLEPNESYFIRAGLRTGLWSGTWELTRVYEDDAVEEMKACCKDGEE
ncbi:MAG: hypothetical protein GKR96_06705 [Gammaproteobacteria bacterium]|nr:hypothetical protein [Gammaproteobacteria bacterium]